MRQTNTSMICIDCEQETYINLTKKSRGCNVCGWETFTRSELYFSVDNSKWRTVKKEVE